MCPEESRQGTVIETLGRRRGEMPHAWSPRQGADAARVPGARARPDRFRARVPDLTRGEAIVSHVFDDWRPGAGSIPARQRRADLRRRRRRGGLRAVQPAGPRRVLHHARNARLRRHDRRRPQQGQRPRRQVRGEEAHQHARLRLRRERRPHAAVAAQRWRRRSSSSTTTNWSRSRPRASACASATSRSTTASVRCTEGGADLSTSSRPRSAPGGWHTPRYGSRRSAPRRGSGGRFPRWNRTSTRHQCAQRPVPSTTTRTRSSMNFAEADHNDHWCALPELRTNRGLGGTTHGPRRRSRHRPAIAELIARRYPEGGSCWEKNSAKSFDEDQPSRSVVRPDRRQRPFSPTAVTSFAR